MKTKRQVFILLVVVLAGILTLSAQNRKEQRSRQKYYQFKEL